MNETSNPTAAKLRSVVPRCPVCHLGVAGHRFGQVATTIVSKQQRPRITEFLTSARQHEWDKLVEFKEWRGDRDDLSAYVVTGAHPRATLIVIRDPFELYQAPQILIEETITAEELAALSSLLPSSGWREL